MNKSHDPRHVSRAIALQQIFSLLSSNSETLDIEVLLEELDATSYKEELVDQIVDGVGQSYSKIDEVIKVLAPAWPLEQIAPVDLNILRMGIWEGFIGKLNPTKVVINEMIELGKQFGGESSGSFINGVLGALLQDKNKKLVEQLNDK